MLFMDLYWYVSYIIYKKYYFHWYFTQYMLSRLYDLFIYIYLDTFFQWPHHNKHWELYIGWNLNETMRYIHIWLCIEKLMSVFFKKLYILMGPTLPILDENIICVASSICCTQTKLPKITSSAHNDELHITP